MDYDCDKCGVVMADILDVGYLGSPDDESCSPFATLVCLCPDCTERGGQDNLDNSREEPR